MKRDTIFYRILQQSPTLLFDLLPTPPPDTQGYRFESIEVKETSFRIDGVLIPPNDNGLVLFSEVQMQPDPKLYERLFSEIGIYTYRHTESFDDWQAIVIYPTRKIEQTLTKVPHELFDSGRILPIYLDELGAIESLPLNIGLLVLTILEGEEAIAQAKIMMARAKRLGAGDAIMEMVSTIISYKFTMFTRDQVSTMLNYTLNEFKQTRYYQDIRDEEWQDALQETALMQLDRKLGQVSLNNKATVQSLTYDRLQQLTLALLDFKTSQDLDNWLKINE